MRFALPALVATLGLLPGCSDPPTVEVTKLSSERFRLSVVAPGVVQGERLLGPEAERLCGRKPIAADKPHLGDGSTVVQEVRCRQAPPPPGKTHAAAASRAGR
jgi:hypothetical protein